MTEELEAMTDRILELLNKSQLEPNHAALALVNALIAVVGSIDCRDCRQLMRKGVEEILPAAFDEAMQRPAAQDHVH